MEFPPVIPTQETCPKACPKPRMLILVAVVVLVVVVVISVVVFLRRRRFESYYLKCGNKFISGLEKIFPNNDDNPAIMMHATANKEPPPTKWEVNYVSPHKFGLRARLGQRVYSLQDGAPGTSAPWGVAYLGPVDVPIGAEIHLVLTPDAYLQACSAPWPGQDYTYLTVQDDVLIWTAHKSSRFQMIASRASK